MEKEDAAGVGPRSNEYVIEFRRCETVLLYVNTTGRMFAKQKSMISGHLDALVSI